jgi:hypothetical protein
MDCHEQMRGHAQWRCVHLGVRQARARTFLEDLSWHRGMHGANLFRRRSFHLQASPIRRGSYLSQREGLQVLVQALSRSDPTLSPLPSTQRFAGLFDRQVRFWDSFQWHVNGFVAEMTLQDQRARDHVHPSLPIAALIQGATSPGSPLQYHRSASPSSRTQATSSAAWREV